MDLQQPWEQQPGESVENFEKFRAYLTHGSIAAAERAFEEPGLGVIAAKHRWRARRAAYVTAIAHEAAEAAIVEARQIGVAHARAALALREAGEHGLLDLIARGVKPTYREALALIQAGVEIERLIAGQATKHVFLDLSRASEEELLELDSRLSALDADARH